MCNTRAKHSLVESAYNERRAKCEEAAQFFARSLSHPVTALRDVSMQEWQEWSPRMDPAAAKRSAHVIGENERVLEGRRRLAAGQLAEFGKLMFASHESSRTHFENSCPELDFLVQTARSIPAVLGARLSGGGFGGSAVALLHPRDADSVRDTIQSAYLKEFHHPCDVRVIVPSDGAHLVDPS
jgi:galactokinase